MNTPMPDPRCPECGAPLTPGAALGLCARCLLAGAAESTEYGAPRSTPPSLAEVASAFPQLEVMEMIGHGGMGAVFKVRQPKLNRSVALKLLPQSLAADPAFAGRFEREAQLLARLSHPNITAVYDYGQAGGFFFLLMEFVDGVNLRQAMRASRFTPAQALGIVPKICEALQYAHDEGVLHRDIKPENILLDAKGRVKLADFGIAKVVGESGTGVPPVAAANTAGTAVSLSELTQAGATLGTPSYMAPEQRDTPGDVDHRADIYSLGVVFYELLTGELPVGKFAPPSALSAADPRVDAIVQQALQKEREHRQHSAGEMKTQVETLGGVTGARMLALPKIRRMIATPAIGLVIASAINVLLFGAGLFLLIFFTGWATTPTGNVTSYIGPKFSFSLKTSPALGAHPAWCIMLPMLTVSLLTFAGAWRMRRLRGYGLAISGAILGIFTPPGLLIGVVFGIWTLVVLFNREVRAAFDGGTPRSQLVGCLIAVGIVVGAIFLAEKHLPKDFGLDFSYDEPRAKTTVTSAPSASPPVPQPAAGSEAKALPGSAATRTDLQAAFAEYEQLLTALREATFELDLADFAEGTEAERRARRADIKARCDGLAAQTARLREKILALGRRAAEPRNR